MRDDNAPRIKVKATPFGLKEAAWFSAFDVKKVVPIVFALIADVTTIRRKLWDIKARKLINCPIVRVDQLPRPTRV